MSESEINQKLTSADFFQSPWEVYDYLRAEAPVYWCEPWSQWIVTRHVDVSFILKNPSLFSSVGWELRYLSKLPQEQREKLKNVYRHYETQVMSNSDAPEHTRLRKLIHRSFSPRVIEALRGQIEELVGDAFANLPKDQEFEWVDSFAYPFPATVIALLFGAPIEDRAKFEKWSTDIVSFIGSGSPQVDLALKLEQSLIEFREYLESLISVRRLEPKEDLLSLMIEKSEDGDSLTQDELISTCITILFAGHETTANLLSILLLELFRHPDQWQLLVKNPDLSVLAVEEALRFNAPVQRIRRVAREDLEIGGVKITKGESVMGFIGSANRDSTVFLDANSFDISREKSQNLSFGAGIHLCIGAALSRLESSIVLGEIVSHFPNSDLAADFQEEYFQNMTFRGVRSLKMILSA
jgi:cytochrome P450